ncbi:hypothetical protein R84B8_00205 [Treponema sp. R8-4-B8]
MAVIERINTTQTVQQKGRFDGKIPFITSLIVSSIESKYLKKIYLFGSYAYGEPNEDSDIDICVIISNDYDDWKAYMDIKNKFRANKIIPCDLIVSTEKTVEDAIKMNERCVENTILTEGILLYGK